ncbi:hypothetical protein CJD36_000555 [Flavipsychrobacter stenotrophus]|uniref:Periplasmic heavy metal sensor n=1 Tax=Flavipsychrobacter stenotrophus TaxID=2077091 RepID=A0A2S7SZA4_9BACT|nr:periplasmic heavy metal sensor [Flavipsychrobacter stenotrophus]PQJ12283.1 hypothetical protein CJD36_000555 [Flavipsychrobacter stenotrophus]
MEDNKASGLWKWLVGLLVVCNMALIAIIWFKPQPGYSGGSEREEHHGRGGKRMMAFDGDLNLSKEQQAKFDAIVAEQHAHVDSLKRLARDVRTQFFNNISVAAPDAAEMTRLSNDLGNYHRLIELQTYNSFREIRSILTDVQKQKFDTITRDVLTRLPEQPRFRGDGMGPAERRRHERGESEQEEQEEHEGGEEHEHRGPPPGDRDGDDGPPPTKK